MAHQCEAVYCIEPFAIVTGKFQPNKSIYLSQLHLSSGNTIQRKVICCMPKELSNVVVRPREPIAQLPLLMIKPHWVDDLHTLHALLCLIGHWSCLTLDCVCTDQIITCVCSIKLVGCLAAHNKMLQSGQSFTPAGFLRLARERCLASSSLATLLPGRFNYTCSTVTV